jgi:hypothetical protein
MRRSLCHAMGSRYRMFIKTLGAAMRKIPPRVASPLTSMQTLWRSRESELRHGLRAVRENQVWSYEGRMGVTWAFAPARKSLCNRV